AVSLSPLCPGGLIVRTHWTLVTPPSVFIIEPISLSPLSSKGGTPPHTNTTHTHTHTHTPLSILTATVRGLLGFSLSMPIASAITTCPKQPSPRGFPSVSLKHTHTHTHTVLSLPCDEVTPLSHTHTSVYIHTALSHTHIHRQEKHSNTHRSTP